MKNYLLILSLLLIGCGSRETEDEPRIEYSNVIVEILLEDEFSIRAIEIIDGNLAFAGNNGLYGIYNSGPGTWNTNVQRYDTIAPEFRAVGSTDTDFFMLSVGSPALLYKTGDTGAMELVYVEEHENVFYDSLTFWNNEEGIAMGDPVENCLSIIITRDGGKSWEKLRCDVLPHTEDGEAAFAASNSNIAIVGDHTWLLSGGARSRVFYSGDKGRSWEVFDTPLVQGEATTGGYSIDFYDERNGFIIGGDYTKPEVNIGNKAVTADGGRTWRLVAEGEDPGYKSSVRYVPNGGARELVAVGFTGITYSFDEGRNWNRLSEEGFYTIRFLNDSTAYAAGKNRIARLSFR